MLVKFWGVHGSLPRPGPKTLKYGGNTPCVEVRCPGVLIILDAGSGIRELGEDLVRRCAAASGRCAKIRAHIFLSHLHWDHVQGLPFFKPGFIRGNEFDVYGVQGLEHHVQSTIRRQMAEPNFPVSIEEFEASFRFHDLLPGQVEDLGGVSVRVQELNHPGGSFGFRLDSEGKSLIYASDTEHVDSNNESLLELAGGGDVLIYDSMFDPDQYQGLWDGIPRISWGHSTWEAAVEVALAAKVKHLVLFHHGNEDRVVEELEQKARRRFPLTTAAYEGLEIEI